MDVCLYMDWWDGLMLIEEGADVGVVVGHVLKIHLRHLQKIRHKQGVELVLTQVLQLCFRWQSIHGDVQFNGFIHEPRIMGI